MPPTKIATCSYCGSRSLLKLTARDGHELACGTCGAPLHEMKAIKISQPLRKERYDAPLPKKWRERPKRKRGKPRKSMFHRLVEEVWDEIEDIFD